MLASYALNFPERCRRHFGLWKLREPGISGIDRPEGGGGGRACLFHHLHRATLLFSRQFLLMFPAAISLVFANILFSFARWRVWYCRPFVLSSILDFFCFHLEQKKENHSSAHARSLPATEFVCIMGCSLLFCSTYYVILPIFPRRFCFVPHFLLVSRGICSEVLPSLLLFRATVSLLLPLVFYCLGTSNSFVSTLSKTKENHLNSMPGPCQLLSC